MQPVLLCTQTACERSKMNHFKKKLSEESHYFCWAIKIETLSKCPFDIPLTAWFFISGPGPVWCFGWNGVRMTPVGSEIMGNDHRWEGGNPLQLKELDWWISTASSTDALWKQSFSKLEGKLRGKRWMQIWWDSLYNLYYILYLYRFTFHTCNAIIESYIWGIRDYVSEAKHC